MKSKKTIVNGCSIILLIVTLFVGLIIVVDFVPFPWEAGKIAEPLNLEPSWKAIRVYMFDSIDVGMTKKEVHAVFDEVGYWEVYFADTEESKSWHPDYEMYTYREQILFYERNRRIALGKWLFQYDENEILIKYEFSDI